MATDIPVIICTDAHCLAGIVAGKGLRLLEMLNDPSSEFLKLQEVLLQGNFNEADKLRLPEATVPKSRIAACLLATESHEAPEKRRYSYVEKQKRVATVLVQGYEVRGAVSLKGSTDPVFALGREFGKFFPVANATVHHAAAKRSLTAIVAIVNRSLVSLMQIGDKVGDAEQS